MTKTKKDAERHLIGGAIWMIAMRWVMRALGLFSTVIVARILSPDDYGVVAIALIAVGLLETAAYLGVDLSLIKDQSAGTDEFDTAWTIQLIQGVLISVLLFSGSSIVAGFFNEPRARDVVALLALRPVIEGLQNIGIVTFRRDLKFAAEFRFNLLTKIAGVFIQIFLALYFRNYWSLIVGMLAASTISTVMSYLMHPYRPRLTLKCADKIWGFSQWLLISRVGSFFSRRSDEFVVGRLIGTDAMGGYHVVYELATMPTTEIVMPMRRALYPALSRVAADTVSFQAMMVDSVRAMAVICVGLSFSLAATADLVVPLLLGEQWVSAVSAARWLSLFGLTTAMSLLLEVPLWVMGKTRLTAFISWIELAIALPLLIFATDRWGVEGAAMVRFWVSLAIVPLSAVMVQRICLIRIGLLFKALVRPLLAGATMVYIMCMMDYYGADRNVVFLIEKIVAGVAAYIGMLCFLWLLSGKPDGVESSVFDALKRLEVVAKLSGILNKLR